ncbi:hypothetical protein Patl1_06093 [Pistacia atlantica]|uniref:Uncharacterized protein n=1 Tax=Pistacia atlantica TaxID=434234 RepID=A0ACC1BRN0_9ROSI|nr:hypothetical protein Patl1_06093 [Pistacia atlantica]
MRNTPSVLLLTRQHPSENDGDTGLAYGNISSTKALTNVYENVKVMTITNSRLMTGIAYISNVAVREKFRRKGIAKRLIAKAEAKARSWGCRAIALHCDLNNAGATKLYKGQGFKSVKVPEGANWPQPRTSPDVNFSFMMKLLNSRTTA